MKRMISLLLTLITIASMLTITVSAAEEETIKLYVAPGAGYWSLWRENQDELPENWTAADLESACNSAPLRADTWINVPIKSSKGYIIRPVLIYNGEGYYAVAKRLGVSYIELQNLNGNKMLLANQIMKLKVPTSGTNGNNVSSGGEAVKEKGKVIGQATLNYNKARKKTMTNVDVAAGLINGTIIRAGETWSWIDDMLPCRKALGYVEAPAISSTGTSQGGGICFVSTTLHAACLDAGLKILERHPHSRASTYAPQYLEASIWRTGPEQKDLEFKNTSGGDLMVVTNLVGKELTIKLVTC